MEVGFLDTGSTPVRSTFCEIADKAIAGDYECNLGDIKSVTPRALIKTDWWDASGYLTKLKIFDIIYLVNK